MNFMIKKAFTLVELIIVILIISLSYFLIFSNNTFSSQQERQIVNLSNIKKVLLDDENPFQSERSFVCIDEDFTCYVKRDGEILKDIEFKNFFRQTPLVYEYEKEEKELEFSSVKINDVNENIIFELKINSDYKTNEFIVETSNKVYVFNSLFEKPFVYNSLQEAYETFEKKQEEVKDAF